MASKKISDADLISIINDFVDEYGCEKLSYEKLSEYAKLKNFDVSFQTFRRREASRELIETLKQENQALRNNCYDREVYIPYDTNDVINQSKTSIMILINTINIEVKRLISKINMLQNIIMEKDKQISVLKKEVKMIDEKCKKLELENERLNGIKEKNRLINKQEKIFMSENIIDFSSKDSLKGVIGVNTDITRSLHEMDNNLSENGLEELIDKFENNDYSK